MSATQKKFFAIGDVHGCAAELETLFERLPIEKDDTVVMLGDYIDRGPESKGVIDLLIEWSSKCNLVALMGNHESMLLKFLEEPESPEAALFILNGGSATLSSYGTGQGKYSIPVSHLKFFNELEYYWETEDYFFVHAGLPRTPLDKINFAECEMDLLWKRGQFLAKDYDYGKTVVHGHTPVVTPDFRKYRINLDTGCVYGGKLSAIELPSKMVYTVEKGEPAPDSYLSDAYSQRSAYRFVGAIKVFVTLGEKELVYETLNYNSLGMLIRETVPGVESLKLKQKIRGVIGEDRLAKVFFDGEIVRVEKNTPTTMYGIRIQNLEPARQGF